MPRHEDTVEQIRRLNPGLPRKRLETTSGTSARKPYEGSRSTVTFVLGGRKLTVDRPHPRKDCGLGLVKRVRSFLETLGYL